MSDVPALPAPSNANKILTRIADVWYTVGPVNALSVNAAYDYEPATVPSANCPFAFIQPERRPGKVSMVAANGYIGADTYLLMVLCVARRDAEPTQQINLALALQWRDAVFQAFASHLQLSPTPASVDQSSYVTFVTEAFITDWLGPIDYQISDTTFTTLQFAYTVREKQVVTFAP